MTFRSKTTDPYPAVGTQLSFRVGPDGSGQWLAIETHGLGGGIFITQAAAMRYVSSLTMHRSGAIVIANEVLSWHQASPDTSSKPRFLSNASDDGARPRNAA